MPKCWSVPDHTPPQGELLPMQHGFLDLVARILAGLEELGAGRGSQRALDKWFKEGYSDFTHETDGCPEYLQILRVYFDFFNKLLFLGALSWTVVVLRLVPRIPRTDSPDGVAKMVNLGDCDEPQMEFTGGYESVLFPETISCQIRIYGISYAYRDHERLRRYVGALLHEMIHAALTIIPYKCTKYRREDYGIQYYSSNAHDPWYVEGYTGHGQFWFVIAKRMRETCEETLKLRISLGRNDALLAEIDNERPEEGEIVEYGMDRVGLEDEVDWGAIGLTRRYLDSSRRDITDLSDASREEEEERREVCGEVPYPEVDFTEDASVEDHTSEQDAYGCDSEDDVSMKDASEE